MNTKLLIFGLILLMSCKKQQPIVIEPTPEPIIQTPTPKIQREFKVFGMFSVLSTKLKGVELKNPFYAYVGDTVNIYAESLYDKELDMYIYFDNTLIENKKGGRVYKTNIIIK